MKNWIVKMEDVGYPAGKEKPDDSKSLVKYNEKNLNSLHDI